MIDIKKKELMRVFGGLYLVLLAEVVTIAALLIIFNSR